MSKQTTEKMPVVPTLKALAVNEKVAFPLVRVTSVRTLCNMLTMTNGMRFSTHINRAIGRVEVTRLE